MMMNRFRQALHIPGHSLTGRETSCEPPHFVVRNVEVETPLYGWTFSAHRCTALHCSIPIDPFLQEMIARVAEQAKSALTEQLRSEVRLSSFFRLVGKLHREHPKGEC